MSTLECQLSSVSLFSGEEFECDLADCQSLESELAYLYYESGGFYHQHFDTPGHRIFREDDDDCGNRRAFRCAQSELCTAVR